MIFEDISNITQQIVDFWDEHGDPRTGKLFLTANLYPLIVITIVAISIVKIVIPMIYKGEKQPQVRYILSFYCFVHFQTSLICTVCFCYYIMFVDSFNFRCQEVDTSNDGPYYHMAMLSYWWAWFKVAEYIELILTAMYMGKVPIYVLMHHIGLPFTVVTFVHFYPGGSPLIVGIINNLEHVFLYGALTLRTISPTLKKKSDPWYRKFHIILTEGALFLTLIFFLQLSPNEHCNFERFKVVATLLLAIFISFSICFRWSYISHKSSFGNTKLIKYINKLIGKLDELTLLPK